MTFGAAHALPPLLLEHADLRSARLAVDNGQDARVGDEGGAGDDLTAIVLDKQHLLERQLRAGLARRTVDDDDGPRRYPVLTTASLNDCVHVRHPCKRSTLQPKSLICKGLQRDPTTAVVGLFG